MTALKIPKGKKIYFASDNHLGAPTAKESMPREKKFVQWLDSIKQVDGLELAPSEAYTISLKREL